MLRGQCCLEHVACTHVACGRNIITVPCTLREDIVPQPGRGIAGTQGALYSNYSTIECSLQYPLNAHLEKTGMANISDCVQAISELKVMNVSNCSTTLNASSVPSAYIFATTAGTPLMTVGSCQILWDSKSGQALPCAQIAEYASGLCTACRTRQMKTGGIFYPRWQSDFITGSAVILSAAALF